MVTYEPNIPSNQRSYTIRNLVGNTPYTIKIKAAKVNENSSVVSQGLRTKLGKLFSIPFSFFRMGITRNGQNTLTR